MSSDVSIVFPQRGDPILDQLEHLFSLHASHLREVGQLVPMVDNAAQLWRAGVERGIGRIGTVAVAVRNSAAASEGEAVGFCYGVIRALPDYLGGAKFATMPHFFVRADLRGQGVGRRLYRAFERWCAERGCTSIESYVAIADDRAMQFWEGASFQREHTQIRRFL